MSDISAPLIRRLEKFPPLWSAAIESVSEAEARWQPAPESWSITQILGHMLDEERDDFRPRLQATLADPEAPWPPIDPPRAVEERKHQAAPLATLLAEWSGERSASLEWLQSIEEADWDRAHQHADLGPLRAGDLLLSWVNHDHLHLRQVVQRLYQLSVRAGAPYRCDYAGPW